jgi:hypothetical protein
MVKIAQLPGRRLQLWDPLSELTTGYVPFGTLEALSIRLFTKDIGTWDEISKPE